MWNRDNCLKQADQTTEQADQPTNLKWTSMVNLWNDDVAKDDIEDVDLAVA